MRPVELARDSEILVYLLCTDKGSAGRSRDGICKQGLHIEETATIQKLFHSALDAAAQNTLSPKQLSNVVSLAKNQRSSCLPMDSASDP